MDWTSGPLDQVLDQILDPFFFTNINILILILIKIVNLGKGGYRFRGNGGWGKVYSYRNKYSVSKYRSKYISFS